MDIGGQALIEGVLIKTKEQIAISIRKKGEIKTKTEKVSNISKKFSKILFLRGIIVLIDTLYIGTKALIYSAKEQEDEEEKTSDFAIGITMFFSFLFAIGVFVLVPLFVSKLLTEERIYFNLIDGILRIIIFVIYLLIISRSKEVIRVFQYHGAEHMAIHCFEDKKELNVKNCRKYSTIHPRCGTSFLFFVLIISIILFSLVWHESFLIKFLQRIVLIPVIASVSYELLKFMAKKQSNLFIRMISMPGLRFQKITTKKPDDLQLEVAIEAVKNAVLTE